MRAQAYELEVPTEPGEVQEEGFKIGKTGAYVISIKVAPKFPPRAVPCHADSSPRPEVCILPTSAAQTSTTDLALWQPKQFTLRCSTTA